MKDWLIEHKLYVIAAFVIVLGGGYDVYHQHESKTEMVSSQDLLLEQNKQDNENDQQGGKKSEKVKTMMVDIKGQIKQPGVYRANVGERVIDIITRAGGLTEAADESQVNFAEHVEDEMVIYIPQKGEEGVSAPGITAGGSNMAAGSSGQNQAKINLNKATEAELQNLPGIGPAKAAAIIEYRETNGPYKAAEDLKNISGIGDKTFEKLQDLIVVR